MNNHVYEVSNTQFYENPSDKSRAVPTGQDGWKDGRDKFKS